MNIIITNHDTQPQYVGGIKKVSSILAQEWKSRIGISLLSAMPDNTHLNIFETPQYILPDTEKIHSKKNIEYFVNIIREKNIDIVFHPHAESKEFTELCITVCKQENVKLITVWHFDIKHNINIVKDSFFNKYRLGRSPLAYIKDFLLFCKYHLYKKFKIRAHDAAYFRFLIKNSDRLVLLSETFIPAIKKLIKPNEIENAKIPAINNPAVLPKSNVYHEKKKKILWCGRVGYDMKRVDKVLDIWKDVAPRHPDWELMVMGCGDIEHFKNICHRHNIGNITFCGHCDPTGHYKEGAILCMTSVTEGWGMVLIEAMSEGCVPIAYNSFSSLTDIIDDNVNGFIIKPFNKKEYINRLEFLMDNPEIREKMGQAGRESIVRFDSKTIAKKWIELFNNLSETK